MTTKKVSFATHAYHHFFDPRVPTQTLDPEREHIRRARVKCAGKVCEELSSSNKKMTRSLQAQMLLLEELDEALGVETWIVSSKDKQHRAFIAPRDRF